MRTYRGPERRVDALQEQSHSQKSLHGTHPFFCAGPRIDDAPHTLALGCKEERVINIAYWVTRDNNFASMVG